jgi:uncharacterized membrane protein
MNDITPATAPNPLASLRQLTLVTYVLYAASALIGLTAIIAVIINYIKREDAQGTIYESHFTWQIRTFWWSLLWAVVGFATVIVGVGFIVLAADSIWVIYRIVKGFLNWGDGKPMPVKA